MSTGSTSAYVGACRKDIPYPSVSHESVPSLIDNLVTALYGTITKTVVNRRVVWNIPCDPNNTATIIGIPRNTGEGLLCYLIRALNITFNGSYTFYGSFVGPLTGNASTATTLQTARNISITGAATAPAVSFNGSANISLNTSIANLPDSSLATITTAGKVSNSATTATNANTANSIVARDASGNFSVGSITGSLLGNATSATNIANGSAGQISWQSGSSTTGFILAGTTGQVLTSNGAASPTWSSNIAGNAGTATKLQTASTIALSGEVTGTATSFDGSGNISIPVTINAGSVTPSDLSTGGPSWTAGGRLTATSYQIGASTTISTGAGSPEGNITAPVGSVYTNTIGSAGLVLFVKESGSGNTGWIAAVTTGIFTSVTSTLPFASRVSITSGVQRNVTSISLTAGTWDISGTIDFTFIGTTSTLGSSNYLTGVTLTSNTINPSDTYLDTPIIVTAGTGQARFSTSQRRLTIASTTTVYLVVGATFIAGSVSAYGTITANRVF